MAICNLCKKDKKLLKRSHIISEFLYKDFYDSKHRMRKLVISNRDNIRNSNPPKGEYESGLLCSDCDGKIIGKYETYASKILLNETSVEKNKLDCTRIRNNSGIDFLQINNIDYLNIKLFLLSLLWRADVSKRRTFRNVILGKYERTIRNQLLSGNPSSDLDIPIVILSWNNDLDFESEFIIQPNKTLFQGVSCYSFVINGYIILFYLNKYIRPDTNVSIRLLEENVLPIIYLPKGRMKLFISNLLR